MEFFRTKKLPEISLQLDRDVVWIIKKRNHEIALQGDGQVLEAICFVCNNFYFRSLDIDRLTDM